MDGKLAIRARGCVSVFGVLVRAACGACNASAGFRNHTLDGTFTTLTPSNAKAVLVARPGLARNG